MSEQQGTEDTDLAYTRRLRMRLIDDMTANGKMPGDNKDRITLLAALNDMDRAALGSKKIKSDQGIADMQAQAAQLLATMFNDPNVKKIGVVVEGAVREIPTIDDLDINVEVKPGELDINPTQENYDSFTKRLGMAE